MIPDLRARGLPWILSSALHGVLLGAILLLPPTAVPAQEHASLTATMRTASPWGKEDFDEEVMALEMEPTDAVIRDAAVADHVETDNDLPYQESFGAGEGISDAPFEGPAHNGLIGVGGGAGGAFRGRGGSRDLRTGGGGRTGPRSPLEPHVLRIRVGETEDLPLRNVRATVRVEGFRARVTLDATFFNDHDRTLEGTFQVRLPDGASPSVLAFGEAPEVSAPRAAELASLPPGDLVAAAPAIAESTGLRFARFAPRERAATAYRETARRRIDPALLEWSAAGVFDARVFPIAPRREHRVVLAYDMSLVPEGDDLAFRFSFPASIPSLDVDLTVVGQSAEVRPGAPHDDGHFRYHDPFVRAFHVRIPRPGSILLTASDPAVGPLFAGLARPDLPAARTRRSERAVFLVDVSSSTDPDRLRAALDLQEAILAKNRPTLREFAVAFFHVDTWWWREGFTQNVPAEVAAARRYAESLALAGATDLSRALRAAAARAGEFDVFLLSDGSATWGPRDASALVRAAGRSHPVFSYALGRTGTDTALLERLARETGGGFFPQSLADGSEAVAAAHAVRPWRIVGAAIEGAEDLLFEGRPSALYPGQVLGVVGRGMPAADAALVLDLESGGVRRQVRTAFSRRATSDLVLGAYGRAAVEHLDASDGEFADLAEAYGLHFGVVSARVSLVMLDADAQYARYGIDPERNVLAVKSSEPGRLMARLATAEAAAGETSPEDPRSPYRAWLTRLEGAAASGGVDARAFTDLLALLPASSLAFERAGAPCRARTWADLGLGARDLLEAPRLDGHALGVAAEDLLARLGAADASRLLSALVEREPGDRQTLCVVGYRALAWGRGGEAFELLERAAASRPDAPQGYAAMAAALAEAGRPDLAMLGYEAALAVTAWPARFGAGRRIAAAEYLSLLGRVERAGTREDLSAWARRRAEEVGRIVGFRDADLVVTIAWSTDDTDVDLHVLDPAGEDCHYAHPRTAQGASLSPDVTQGFGPEMFVLPKAAPGEYVAKVVYYRSDDRRLSLRSNVVVTLYESWGRPDEKVTRSVVPLATGRQEMEILRLRR